MKRLALYLLFVILCKAGLGCTYHSIHIWPPPQSTIPTKPTFVITVLGYTPITNIINKGGLKLASKSDTVTLLLLDTLVGEYAHFQAIVTTERELEDNATYSIFFDSSITSQDLIDNFYHCLPKTQVGKNRYIIYDMWSTSNATALKINNTDAPLIKFQSSHYVAQGTSCQNVEATFSYRYTDTTPTIFKVTIWNKQGAKSFFILARKTDDLLHIDTDAFGITSLKKYRILIQAMDMWGNYSPPSKTKRFHTPYLYPILSAILYLPAYLITSITQ